MVQNCDLIATGLLDSLSVVALLVELEHRLGVVVRMEEIDLNSLRTLDSLRALVHMIGGGVAMLRGLAAALEASRPVAELRAQGLEPSEEPLETAEAMASSYVTAIRSAQPVGPYALCGYSFGGLIAFEMACQLSAAGEAIDFLVLIDPQAHPRNLPRALPFRIRPRSGLTGSGAG